MLPKPENDKLSKVFLILVCALFCSTIFYTTLVHPKDPIVIVDNDQELPDDYSQLIDLKNFSFLILNQICSPSTKVLISVSSAPRNSELRDVIRTTWGQKSPGLALVFLVGLVQNASLQKDLEVENDLYHDLAQGSFYDSYKNLSYKTISELKYAVHFCTSAKYVLRTDDDVFVNTLYLTEFLETHVPVESHFLMCHLRRWSEPQRNEGKWKMSLDEYPGDYYPPYCFGPFILFHFEDAVEIYKVSQNAKYFWIEDVFVTGILAQTLGLKHFDISQWVLTYKELYNIVHGSQKELPRFLFGQFDLKVEEIEKLWQYVNDV